jgi:LDH2 family malate/lactate/ureidoglycolate dehydrogenase
MPPQQPGRGIGHFFGAMRIDAFRPADEFKKHMDNWIRGFRSCQTTPGHQRVLVPGDPEREAEAERIQNGIELMDTVVDDLRTTGAKFGVTL